MAHSHYQPILHSPASSQHFSSCSCLGSVFYESTMQGDEEMLLPCLFPLRPLCKIPTLDASSYVGCLHGSRRTEDIFMTVMYCGVDFLWDCFNSLFLFPVWTLHTYTALSQSLILSLWTFLIVLQYVYRSRTTTITIMDCNLIAFVRRRCTSLALSMC